MQYKLGPFSYAIVSFLGFSKDEMRHMEEVTVANGMMYYPDFFFYLSVLAISIL